MLYPRLVPVANEWHERMGMNARFPASHDEFIAYQTKIFDMMDTSTTHKGMLGKEEVMFATGGAKGH